MSGEEQIARWILERAGLDSGAYSRESLLRRLPACMRALKVRSPADCLSLLMQRPDLVPVAAGTFLIGVTQFFRDPAVFETLRARVLPVLAESTYKPLTVLSVGCSNGAELYSIAILLAESNLLERCVLLGTDCRADAIEQASRGEYLKTDNIPSDILTRYFEESGRGTLKPVSALQDHVKWKVSDALECIEPGPWDMVLCRNMVIYFNLSATLKLWSRVFHFIRPGGFLVTGKAEQRLGTVDLRRLGRSVYRKTGQA